MIDVSPSHLEAWVKQEGVISGVLFIGVGIILSTLSHYSIICLIFIYFYFFYIKGNFWIVSRIFFCLLYFFPIWSCFTIESCDYLLLVVQWVCEMESMK